LRVAHGILAFDKPRSRCATLLRSSNTQHWIRLGLESSSNAYQESLHARVILDSCHSTVAMPPVGANMRSQSSTKATLARSRAHASAFGRNDRHLEVVVEGRTRTLYGSEQIIW
jgi:hypothetical protein